MTTRTEGVHDLSIGMAMADDLTKILVKPASKKAVDSMLKADETSLDGRSNWLWFRLPDGDLIFGCFPEGDEYHKHAMEYPNA